MHRVFLSIAALLALVGAELRADPPAEKITNRAPTRAQLLESANGWNYVNGQWIHPDGYKIVNNKIVRTTANSGKAFPKPPGKLAQENAALLAPRTKPAAPDTRTTAEKAAEEKRRNLTPKPASQTGSHL